MFRTRGRGRGRRGPPSLPRIPRQHLNTAYRNSRLDHRTEPLLVRRNKQIISLPNHSYGLKLQRKVRFQSVALSTECRTFTTGQVLSRAFLELGITSVTGAALYMEVLGVDIYGSSLATASISGSSSTTLTVGTFDNQAGVSTLSTAYTDTSSVSGISSVCYLYPATNRPLSNGTAETNTNVVRVSTSNGLSTAGTLLTVDFKVSLRINSITCGGLDPIVDPTPDLFKLCNRGEDSHLSAIMEDLKLDKQPE